MAKEKLKLLTQGRRLWAVGILAAVLVLAAGIFIANVTAEDTWVYINDTDGPNDVPGQKDLTRFGIVPDALNPLKISWNWDEVWMSGANTADGCALFDTDNDGFVNYALCHSWYDGQLPSVGYPKLYECTSDSKPINCMGDVERIPSANTLCTIANSTDDPFPAGANSPNDTKSSCTINLADVGGVKATLLDVCSYSSPSLSSKASDCVVISVERGNLEIEKDVVPDDPNTNWVFTVSGPTSFVATLGGEGSAGNKVVDAGNYTIVETAGAGTNLDDYNTTWACTKDGVPWINGTGTRIPAIGTFSIAKGDIVVCKFTNTRKYGSLEVTKVVNWNGVTPVDGTTFNICIQGPSYPVTPNCKTFTYPNDLTQTWPNLLPGEYTITEDPGVKWSVVGSGQKVPVLPSQTATATVTNTRLKSNITACKVEHGTQNYLAGWTINLAGPDPKSGVTGEDGCVTFTVTEPGAYTLSEEVQAGWTLMSPADNQHPVTVELGKNYSNYQFANFKWATVKACKYDTDGKPLSGWSITADGVTQITGEDGCTTFTLKQPGSGQICEKLEPGWTNISPLCYEVILASGGTYEFTFTNFQWATVKACKVDTDGKALSGWEIKLDGVKQTTGEDGCTTFTVKQPGEYTVAETLKANWTNISPLSYPVTVKTGGKYEFKFENFEWATVKACKVDTDGKALAGWDIKLDGVTQKTGDDGCTTFTVKQPGEYTVSEVLKDGWTNISPLSYPVTVKTGGKYEFKFENFKWATVKACKVDPQGKALAGWTIKLGDEEKVTDDTGCVTFTIKNPGSYTIAEVLQSGWFPITAPSVPYTAVTGDEKTITFVNAYPAIDIEKSTNGQDADTPTGPYIKPGSEVTWTYVVKNTGNVALAVVVTDNVLGEICKIESLAAGATETCTTAGTATRGQYSNEGEAKGCFGYFGEKTQCVTDSDPSHYFGASPDIDVEKYISVDGGAWDDADAATGPVVLLGTPIKFKFWIKNTGNVALSGVTLTDTDFDLSGCPAIPNPLAVGGEYECIISTTATVHGQHVNTATAKGSFTDSGGTTTEATDTDDAHYKGVKPAEVIACKQNTEGVKLSGWDITLGNVKQTTGENGCTTFYVPVPGTYTLAETLQDRWTQIAPAAPGTFAVTVEYDKTYGPFTFVNFKNVEITGCKIKTNDNTYVPGWTLYLWKDGALFDTKQTGPNGCYTWTVTAPGKYQIKEGSWNFWTPVGPTESPIWDVTSGSGPFTFTFRNFRTLGCAYTQGYWKTHADPTNTKKYDPVWNVVGGPYAMLLNSGLAWIDVFNTPPKGGNPWYILAHQYMAAKLNYFWGADTTMVDEYIAKAEYLLSTYPRTYDFKDKANAALREEFIMTASMLDAFNNGYNYPQPGWPPHCG